MFHPSWNRWCGYFRLGSIIFVALLPPGLRANPTGGQVVSGTAKITTTPGTVTINQATTTASINWQDFSIAAGELTKFQVPSSTSATLNRVTGGNISAIYGTLQSNGQLYLINPNGIVVGATGKIDTAGFIASTLNFSDTQFGQQGDLNLTGASTAGVSNEGTIHASTGDVYLIAAQVDNSGTITAPKGTVGLAAGNSVLLQKAGDQHLFVQVDGTTKTPGTGVKNSGSIRAAAAELKAAGGNAYALAINNTGNIKATGIATVNGQVYLTSDGGDITNAGTISATQANGNGGTVVVNAHHAKNATKGTLLNSGTITAAGAKGGTVELLGDRVGVTAGKIDVSGTTGGGTALIGGDTHGTNAAVPDADATYLGPDATIDADALTLGSGGKVILWGNDTTQVYGRISARGGAAGGNGGFVETSAANLDARTAPDFSAPKGQGGTWLLDPSDVTIDDDINDSGFSLSPAFTLTGNPVTISQGTLLTALEGGDVTINASTGSGGTGTIYWTAATPMNITNANGHTLTLDAPVSLELNGVVVSATGTGGLNLTLNSDAAAAGGVLIQFSNLSLNGGNMVVNGTGSVVPMLSPPPVPAIPGAGVSLIDSTFNAAGGDITIAGTYSNASTTIAGGAGTVIFSSGTGGQSTTIETSGAGNIGISGTFAQAGTTSTEALTGLVIAGAGTAGLQTTTIQAGTGTISLSGTVSSGTSSTPGGDGLTGIAGLFIVNGVAVKTTGAGGKIALSGSAAGSTFKDLDNDDGAVGIELDGASTGVTNTFSITTGGSITMNGTGGASDASADTAQVNAPDSVGVEIGGGDTVTTGNNSTISITGQGGSAINPGSFAGLATGVVVGSDTLANGAAAISVGDNGGVSIMGTGGTSNTTSATAIASAVHPAGATGVSIDSNSSITATGSSTITITGNGGTVTSGTNKVGQAIGVTIDSISSANPTTISSANGDITINATAGAAPNLDLGFLLFGDDGAAATLKSGAGNIDINGFGGSATVATGNSISGFIIPSYSVLVADDAFLQTTSGSIVVTGSNNNPNVSAIVVAKLPAGSFDTAPTTPTLEGSLSGSAIVLAGNAGEVDATGTLSAFDFIINSVIINLSGATVTTSDFNFENGSSGGLILGYQQSGQFGGNFLPGSISISNSVIHCAGAQIGNTADASQGSLVSIDGTTIDDTLGTNPQGSAELQITGSSAFDTAGAPGVSITGASLIETDSGDIHINGTGLVAAGSDAVGVLISGSSSVTSAGTGNLSIQGDSDVGFTSATPNATFANNSYGVKIDHSTISSTSTNVLEINGKSYAANNVNSNGVDLTDGTTVETFGGNAEIKGKADSESFANSSGEAYLIAGVQTDTTQLIANGAKASIGIEGDGSAGLADDHGNTGVEVRNLGVYLLDNTTITAAGDTDLSENGSPIHILGSSGQAFSSSGNSLQAESIGVWVYGGNAGATIRNDGTAGAITIAGVVAPESGGVAVTGPEVAAFGIDLGSSNGDPVSVTAPNGGSIGLAGLGGSMTPGAGDGFFDAIAVGVGVQDATVSTTTGSIAILGAAGSVTGTLPGSASVRLIGVGIVQGGVVQTNLSTGGGTAIPSGGGTVPPLILLYGTDSTYQLPIKGSNTTGSFVPGSATQFAVEEDTNSTVTTGNLVMGNFYDLFTAYGSAKAIADAPTFAQFNNFITGSAANTISTQHITFNPAGIVSLPSTTNQVTNLDSALDGSGGLTLYDSISLTVDPIGGSNNLNYGQIDQAGAGPVSITVALDKNLTLTDVSPLTGVAASAPVIGSAIDTTGASNTITLTTSGNGMFINNAGAAALSVAGGANYIIYASKPANVQLNGINPVATLYNTTPGGATGSTANTIVFASMAPIVGTSVLDGTAFTDGGTTLDLGATINLVFDGMVLGSTTTDATTGAYSFTIGGSGGIGTAADLNSGVLLIDTTTGGGNTYYQANVPPATILGIDIWGGHLRIQADTARDASLAQVIGGLPAGSGVNYTFGGNPLGTITTNPGVNLDILPHTNYVLDGNIVVNGTLTTASTSTFATQAAQTAITAQNMVLAGSLSSAGAVNLLATGTGTITGTITDSGPVSVGSFILQEGNWTQVVGQNGLVSLPSFSVTSDFELQGTSTFLRAAGIDAANGNAYEITDVYGLQGLASPSGSLLGANAELLNNIGATGTATWNPTGSTPTYAGFVPIGNSETPYTGTFNGRGFSINGLNIQMASTTANSGLFAQTSAGSTIENVGLTNVDVRGGFEVGGLVGNNLGTINNAYVTGTVAGVADSDNAGGLVGLNSGMISNSHSSTTVLGYVGTDIGGLVGFSTGPLSTVYSTGAVTGNGSVDVGGLVGDLRSTLNIGYSSGPVSDSNSSYLNIGGLVGFTSGSSITNSFSVGSVSTSSGGETVYVGGLVGFNGGTVSNTYATGSVSSTGGAAFVGGFIGSNGGSVSNSFWDTETAGSGIVSGVGSDEVPNTTMGVTASTTAQLESQAYIEANATTMPGFDFTNVWTTYGDTLTPQLIGLPIAGQVPVVTTPIILTIDPSKSVNDALFSIVPELLDKILGPNVIGGTGGVAGDDDFGSDKEIEARLTAKYGRARAQELLAIIREDRKDGSTVNTGTTATKWAANTGLSKLLRIGEGAQLFQGLTQGQPTDPLILNLFQQQDSPSLRNELSQAAGGNGHGH